MLSSGYWVLGIGRGGIVVTPGKLQYGRQVIGEQAHRHDFKRVSLSDSTHGYPQALTAQLRRENRPAFVSHHGEEENRAVPTAEIATHHTE